MAPDAADLPQRLVTEELPLSGLEQQLEALAQHALELSRSDLTRASDTADSLLRRLGVADAAAAIFIRGDRDARRLLEGRAGKMVQVRSDDTGALKELIARFPALDSALQATHFTRLTIVRLNGRWHSRIETAPLVGQVRLGSGTIRSSLFAATDEAKLPDSIASQMVDIFSTDIDFHRQLRKGDTFSVVFEALTADDQPITWNEGTGRILAAEFTNNGKTAQAVWFKDSAGRGAYFSFDGQSKRRAFLASPMEFSRITSGFAMRLHPIMQTWRAHNGVDYGAPAGTPVRAVGDGLVDFAGWQNGYGNVVHVKHDGNKTTVYAHLSKLEVRKGQRIDQGQRVGLVGATGWATGPHLHFEFRVDGHFQDPLKIARAADTVVVDAAARPRFQQTAVAAHAQLDAAESLVGYRGDSE
ncbi:M23 family metallopeptidase [Aquincola sp. S2]|uniref:M23 family metallopeptidase n=2 Tax=Pseudaquabacterium terrae TaxID=2732868 RepID=A0ABX2ECX5_9BURK|nr:M23 family metallopeptidase [Aquabacterium terrae]